MIGQFGERNVVRMSAAVTFGGTLRDIQKTPAREFIGRAEDCRLYKDIFSLKDLFVGR